MASNLSRREGNSEVPVGDFLQEARFLEATRCLDGRVQGANVGIGYGTGERNFAAGTDGDLVPLSALA